MGEELDKMGGLRERREACWGRLGVTERETSSRGLHLGKNVLVGSGRVLFTECWRGRESCWVLVLLPHPKEVGIISLVPAFFPRGRSSLP